MVGKTQKGKGVAAAPVVEESTGVDTEDQEDQNMEGCMTVADMVP